MEKMKYYLDSNIFIYAEISSGAEGKLSKNILLLMESEKIKCVTSCLTIDEVVWKIGKETDRKTGIEVGKRMPELPNLEILPVKTTTIATALELMEKHKLGPRDSIHIATMIENGVFSAISEDSDFDKIREIKRLSPEKAAKVLKT
ncbi:hypothetical protein A3K63_01895 [Candidatus Micrarchaeota archaeon RBG_16_49_10]|nr:MAG: hypothetical protein A3K63_01895 [Candidatus Micrarchaeota archaeon RBG_16_49_10]